MAPPQRTKLIGQHEPVQTNLTTNAGEKHTFGLAAIHNAPFRSIRFPNSSTALSTSRVVWRSYCFSDSGSSSWHQTGVLFAVVVTFRPLLPTVGDPLPLAASGSRPPSHSSAHRCRRTAPSASDCDGRCTPLPVRNAATGTFLLFQLGCRRPVDQRQANDLGRLNDKPVELAPRAAAMLPLVADALRPAEYSQHMNPLLQGDLWQEGNQYRNLLPRRSGVTGPRRQLPLGLLGCCCAHCSSISTHAGALLDLPRKWGAGLQRPRVARLHPQRPQMFDDQLQLMLILVGVTAEDAVSFGLVPGAWSPGVENSRRGSPYTFRLLGFFTLLLRSGRGEVPGFRG